MMLESSLRDWWKDRILSVEDLRAHQIFLQSESETRFQVELMYELHYLLQEELKALELACVLKRGEIQNLFRRLHGQRQSQRTQIEALESELHLHHIGDNKKYRSESISYSSFQCYTLDHLNPMAFLGPFFHLHLFLIEWAHQFSESNSQFFRSLLSEEEDFYQHGVQVLNTLKSEDLELIHETGFTAAKILEYLLLSIVKDARSSGMNLNRQEPVRPPHLLFHERRAPLMPI